MKYFRNILNASISALILFFLLTQVSLEEIIALIKQSKAGHFTLAVLVAALSIYVNAWRWQILLKYLDFDYDLKLLTKISFVTFFFNVYLPGGVAGEIARIAMLPEKEGQAEERKVHLSKVTASVVTDKVVGLIGIMLLAMIGLVFSYRLLLNTQLLIIFSAITAAILAVTVLLFSRRTQALTKKVFAYPLKILNPIKATVKSVVDSLLVYRDNYAVLNLVIPISILGHLLVVAFFILLAESMEVIIDFSKMVVFIPIIEFVSSLPISLGGLGIREATTIILFGSEGITAAKAMGVSLLSFAVILIVGALGGIFYLLRKPASK